jgi:hypothetical protein
MIVRSRMWHLKNTCLTINRAFLRLIEGLYHEWKGEGGLGSYDFGWWYAKKEQQVWLTTLKLENIAIPSTL